MQFDRIQVGDIAVINKDEDSQDTLKYAIDNKAAGGVTSTPLGIARLLCKIIHLVVIELVVQTFMSKMCLASTRQFWLMMQIHIKKPMIRLHLGNVKLSERLKVQAIRHEFIRMNVKVKLVFRCDDIKHQPVLTLPYFPLIKKRNNHALFHR